MSNMFKDPHDDENRIAQNLFLFTALVLNRIPYFAYLFENMGQCLRILRSWSDYSAHDTIPMKNMRRERLWDRAIDIMESERFIVFEFGVAWGYSTYYWTQRSNSILEWHGYDTFTGLPESWGKYEKGHFSRKGRPPEIADERVRWHIGLVEETFDAQLLKNRKENQYFCFLFDLDLFTPTYYVLSKIANYLRKRDLIYFDEPHDQDEGALLHVLLRLNPSGLRIIDRTPCQVLIEVCGDEIVFPNFVN